MHKRLKVLQRATLSVALGALAATAHGQSQGSWTMKAPIPIARNEVALAAVGGKVHVIGGSVQGVAGTYHDEYDPCDRSLAHARGAAAWARSHRHRRRERQDLHRRWVCRFGP